MPEIIPRWEWRTFGSRFGVAEDRFGALTPGAIQESDEVYLLGGSGDNVKIRADLMDIKVLRETDADGLERWEPVMKAGFPLAAADVQRVFEALHLETPPLDRETYTLDQFIAGPMAATGKHHATQVHKRRVRYTVDGCTSEVTEVTADGRPTRTIAIESEDAQAVVRAVAAMGLDGYANTNYTKGLNDLLAGAPERFAVVDVGTNSIKFHVGERRPGGGWTRIVDRADVTQLGEGLREGGFISHAALERAIAAIGGMVDEAKREGARGIVGVATAGVRMAANASDVVRRIHERTGLDLTTISGDDESRLAYLAATGSLDRTNGTRATFDTGGDSTQLTFGHGKEVDERFSVNVGAVRFTEAFGLANPVDDGRLEAARRAIATDLARLDGRARPDALVGLGGALTNMAAVRHRLATYDPDVVHGTVLDGGEIDRQIELYRSRDADARRQIVGLQPERAAVILAGALIVRTVMDKLGSDALTVSDRGLRHGVLIERFGA
jgi:exopolyphosphatase/guanosine-5'-triphosphate,3'-diphosphate pyrophosphatase